MALVATLVPSFAGAQNATPRHPTGEPPPQFAETIEVVGATPIHGLGIDRNKIPSNAQVILAGDLARTPGIHPGEQIAAALASVHVNEAQSNPFQPDIQFRGFTASPLLGLPQGMAIYQDGVRLNEPFGDTVNWDVLPPNAIAGVNLMPGSNPLFGLNALGGALSLQTKTGFSQPGHGASVFAGSFGRRWLDLHSAGHTDRLGYFATARLLDEDGWRDFSPSRAAPGVCEPGVAWCDDDRERIGQRRSEINWWATARRRSNCSRRSRPPSSPTPTRPGRTCNCFRFAPGAKRVAA